MLTSGSFTCRVLAASPLDTLAGEWSSFGLSGPPDDMRSASFVLLKLYGVSRLRNAIECLLGASTSAAVFRVKHDQALLGGAMAQLRALCEDLHAGGLAAVAAGIRSAIDNYSRTDYALALPGRTMPLAGRPKVMGILNVTPDSFSDGGQHATTEAAVAHGLRMAAAGAEIIDVGGESTRPGAPTVPVDEEAGRVEPVISALSRNTDVPISVDTSKYEVARRALDAGAVIINDVTALRADPQMARLAADRGAPLILMHMQGTPRTMQQAPHYDDLMGEIAEFLRARIEFAAGEGVSHGQIVIDPGIGFGKTPEDNLEVLRRLRELRSLGFPLLVGASRKSTLGLITGSAPAERVSGSLAAAAAAALNGAHILRVHDVAETLDVLKVCESVRQGRVACK